MTDKDGIHDTLHRRVENEAEWARSAGLTEKEAILGLMQASANLYWEAYQKFQDAEHQMGPIDYNPKRDADKKAAMLQEHLEWIGWLDEADDTDGVTKAAIRVLAARLTRAWCLPGSGSAAPLRWKPENESEAIDSVRGDTE